MKLSSKSITAIKMFIDLGEHYQDGFISLKDISIRKEVSKKFLEQIVPVYKSSGLLLGNRGNQGGYKLSKEPSKITLKDIIYPFENYLNKEKINFTPIDNVTEEVDNALDGIFSNILLSKLIEDQKESYSYNYSI